MIALSGYIIVLFELNVDIIVLHEYRLLPSHLQWSCPQTALFSPPTLPSLPAESSLKY